jgi:hypothetical protein
MLLVDERLPDLVGTALRDQAALLVVVARRSERVAAVVTTPLEAVEIDVEALRDLALHALTVSPS